MYKDFKHKHKIAYENTSFHTTNIKIISFNRELHTKIYKHKHIELHTKIYIQKHIDLHTKIMYKDFKNKHTAAYKHKNQFHLTNKELHTKIYKHKHIELHIKLHAKTHKFAYKNSVQRFQKQTYSGIQT